jgi:predicted Zn-dependent protease
LVLPRVSPVCGRPGRGRPWRQIAFATGFIVPAVFFFSAVGIAPAHAQGIELLRDTETEDMLKSFEAPLAKAAGLDPTAVHMYLVGDPEVNAFAADGQNIFVMSGIILYCKNPNELIGVMAHETGHIAAGHISRTAVGEQHAMIPMLLSMVLGAAAMALGAGEAGMVIMSAGMAVAQAQMAAFTRVQESTADQIALKLLLATHQSPMGLYSTFERFATEEAQSAYKIDPYVVDHPVGQQRLADIEQGVNASPWRDVKDPPQVAHTRDGSGQAGGFHHAGAGGAQSLSGKQYVRARALCPRHDLSAQARTRQGAFHHQQPDFGRAQQSLLL